MTDEPASKPTPEIEVTSIQLEPLTAAERKRLLLMGRIFFNLALKLSDNNRILAAALLDIAKGLLLDYEAYRSIQLHKRQAHEPSPEPPNGS